MKQGKLINIFKKEDGAGLVLALMVLMVLAVLGVAVAGVTIGSYKLGHISRDSNSAYYIAEAGANLAYEEIKNGVMGAYETSANSELNYFTKITEMVSTVDGTTYNNFSDQFGDKPTASIKIEPAANNVKEYTIVSTGEINGTSRTVRKPFTVNWVNKNSGIGLPPLPDDCVLYIGNKISFGVSLFNRVVTVNGDIKASPNFQGTHYYDSKIEHLKTDGVTSNTIDSSKNLDMEPYRKIKFPELPETDGYDSYTTVNSRNTSTISKSSYIKTLTVGTVTGYFSSPLTIDTGNEGATINLVVDNLKVYNDINITGNGTVNLYVTSSMDFVSILKGLKVGGAKVDQLNILYSGSDAVNIGQIFYIDRGNINFTGTIFLKQAEMLFYNNVELEGIIVTLGKSLTIAEKVQVTAVIYAPNSSVTMLASSQLNGGLVAKNVTFYGGLITAPNTVTYSPLDEYVKQYLFGTGTGETPDLGELISSEAAVEP